MECELGLPWLFARSEGYNVYLFERNWRTWRLLTSEFRWPRGWIHGVRGVPIVTMWLLILSRGLME